MFFVFSGFVFAVCCPQHLPRNLTQFSDRPTNSRRQTHRDLQHCLVNSHRDMFADVEALSIVNNVDMAFFDFIFTIRIAVVQTRLFSNLIADERDEEYVRPLITCC